MEVVFNSPTLYVVTYPDRDGVEVIDKRKGRGAFMSGGTAQRFRRELVEVVAQQGGPEAVDEVVEHFDALLTQPAVLH